MPPEGGDLDAWLARSLQDHRLSRGERQAFRAFADEAASPPARAELRDRAFAAARAALTHPEDGWVLEWLAEILRALQEGTPASAPRLGLADSHFSPGEDCLNAILRHLAHARKSADICVFTITDDRIAEGIIEAHRRGVPVRILTDDAKAEDLGSDVDRLEAAGIPVRIDRSSFHMHHKFAILDGSVLLTGSYNWTRGAARDNEENLIATDDPRHLAAFARAFEHLWEKFG